MLAGKLGGVQDWSLRVTHLIDHAARECGSREIATRWSDGSIERTDWAGIAHDARRLAQAFAAMGLQPGDRWCLCASRWQQALEAGAAPQVVLGATHVLALEDVSLDVKPGRFVVLVGPSGCGKSTLLMMMAGLREQTSGTITISGAPIPKPDPNRVGVVFQEASLFPWLTAEDNVEFPLALRGIPKSEAEAMLLEAFGVEAIGRVEDDLRSRTRRSLRSRFSAFRFHARSGSQCSSTPSTCARRASSDLHSSQRIWSAASSRRSSVWVRSSSRSTPRRTAPRTPPAASTST